MILNYAIVYQMIVYEIGEMSIPDFGYTFGLGYTFWS